MYIDRKVTLWVRDFYDNEVTEQDIIDDLAEDHFKEREVLYETEELYIDSRGDHPWELFDDNGTLLRSYDT